MRLSMYILEDWLKKYAPQASVRDGRRCIRNVRPFSEEHRFTENNVYIGRMDAERDGAICTNGYDFLYLKTADAEQLLSDVMDAFDFYNGWSDGLNQRLVELTPQQILEESQPVFERLLILADASYCALAYTEIEGVLRQDPSLQTMIQEQVIDGAHILNVERDGRIRQNLRHSYILSSGEFFVNPSVRNLFFRGRHWGWLIGVGGEWTRGMLDLLDELGDILEHWAELHEDELEGWERAGVFTELLDGAAPERPRVDARMKLLGWRPEDEKRLYAIRFRDKGCENSLALLGRMEVAAREGQSFLYGDGILTVLHASRENCAAFEDKAAMLLESFDGQCGKGPVFQDIYELPCQYALAAAALDLAPPGEERGRIHPFSKIAFSYALSLIQEPQRGYILHPALQTLRLYDAGNGTALYDTLALFLASERSLTETAAKLYIHRNSLMYRITRIRELTGVSLDDAAQRQHLMLSFALDEAAAQNS